MPLEIVRNDITKMAVDAIVNPTNELLRGGSGGTDGCIHRAAGPQLLEECRMLGGCSTGDAKITKGYKLPCRYVIHTVGPVWHGGGYGEREKLISCYRKSLELAKKYGCETVACPIISSGSYGYPKEEALRIAADTIGAFLEENEMSVYIVVFDKTVFKISSELFADIAEYIDDNYVDAFAKARRERRRQLPWQRNYDALENMPPLCESYESVPMPCAAAQSPLPTDEIGLGEMLRKLDTGFSETLLKLIDRTGKKDSEIYKKANVDRKLFSKIRNNPDYKPSKATAIAFAIALELDIEETRDLISRAGYALTHSSKFDVIIEYFIKRGQYDIIIINEALFAFDQSLLGA